MPLKRLSAAVASQIESIYGYMYKYDEVVKENEQLHMQLAALERERREYVEVSEENEHFRQLLQLASRHSDYQFENASVISWGASNYTSSFTVSKGSENSDVAVGDSVITESGVLIGVITEVRDKTSVAVTVIDTKFSAGCVIAGRVDYSVLFSNVTVEEGAEVDYSIVMPGARVESGAVVDESLQTMIAENAVIESGAEVGEDPEKCDDLSNWGVTVIGSEVTVGKDAKVSAKLMIDEDVKEGEVK